MKIISIEIENIKRLSAVAITPSGEPIVTIAGRNGAGKSSVLDAISMALGGAALCPVEPIRRGEKSGSVSVNLGDYIVTRRFTRGAVAGDVKSALTVTNSEGAKFPSPQALLDKLVSDLTFDPLGFLSLSPREQREQVRRFVGLDFTALDAERALALARAAEARGVVTMAERDVEQAEHYPDAPTAGVDTAALLAQLKEAELLRSKADEADRVLAEARRNLEHVDSAIASHTAEITKAEEDLRRVQERLASCRAALQHAEQSRSGIIEDGKRARAAATSACAAIPDTANIRRQLGDASTINARVAANARYAALLEARAGAAASLIDAQAEVKAIDAQKAEALASAAFPVEGLGFGDDGLTFRGLPFTQASTAEQLRVAVAMGLAQNPKLRVLLVKHGNDLDKASLQLLAELATKAEAQVWLEVVRESPDGVSVFIADGAVALALTDEAAS